MKKLLLIAALFLVSFYNSNDILAQSDSVKVEYKQESADSTNFFQRRKYKYLDIKLKDEKNLFKIGVDPLLIYEEMKFRIKPHIIFEKKISPAWSLIFEDVIEYSIDNDVNDYRYYNIGLLRSKSLTNTINFGTRYYYGMNNAIREKTSGNNLNGNYFEFMILSFPQFLKYSNTYKYTNETGEDVIRTFKNGYANFEFLSAHLAWGLQRRLSNYSFVDAKLYMDFLPLPGGRSDSWKVGIDLIFGFGYNFKRK